MDILLCGSYFFKYEKMNGARVHPYLPLGILYVASFLRQFTKYQVGIFDSTFADGERAFQNALRQFRPRVVGIQGVITTRMMARTMIRIAKEMGCRVIVGGPDPSVCFADYLQWGADFAVIGEGELTVRELLEFISGDSMAHEPARIAGIAFHCGQQIRVTAPRDLIKNLDEIPFPAYDLVDVEHYLQTWRKNNGYSSMTLVTSRGCPFECRWCSHAVFGRTFRQRSIENVIAEMRYLKETWNPDHLTIADDTLGINRKWLYDWCDAVQKQDLKIPFRCFSRADVLDAEMLSRLKATGCRHIFLGVESGSQRILDAMHKGTTVADIRRASRLVREAGIDLGYFIMFAYPGETRYDICKTEQLIYEVRPESLGLSLAYPVPGTPFYELVKDRLVRLDEGESESLGSGRQLRFRATYPTIYYRHLLRYVETRWALKRRNRRDLASLGQSLRMVIDYVFLRSIEWLLPRFKWILGVGQEH